MHIGSALNDVVTIKTARPTVRSWGKDAIRRYKGCKSSFNHSYCIGQLGLGSGAAAKRCEKKLADYFNSSSGGTYDSDSGQPSSHMQNFPVPTMARAVTGKDVRAFYLVPSDVAATGFLQLANLSQGKVKIVPQDATSPEPYSRALMEIADKLSRRIACWSLQAKGCAKVMRIVVRQTHVWSGLKGLPTERCSGSTCENRVRIVQDLSL